MCEEAASGNLELNNAATSMEIPRESLTTQGVPVDVLADKNLKGSRGD